MKKVYKHNIPDNLNKAKNKGFIEIWKDIPNWIGIYQVSNLGNVRSLDRVIIDKNCNKRTQK